MTLTIEVPDDLSVRLDALPQAYDKQSFAVAAIADAIYAAEADEADENEPLDAELIAALEEGREALKTGPFLTMEQVEASALAFLASAVAHHHQKAA